MEYSTSCENFGDKWQAITTYNNFKIYLIFEKSIEMNNFVERFEKDPKWNNFKNEINSLKFADAFWFDIHNFTFLRVNVREKRPNERNGQKVKPFF